MSMKLTCGEFVGLAYTNDNELREFAEEILAENAKLREELADEPKCETCEAMLDCDECLRADESQKERKSIAFENAKLRELVQYILDENYGDDWFYMKAKEIGLEARY